MPEPPAPPRSLRSPLAGRDPRAFAAFCVVACLSLLVVDTLNVVVDARSEFGVGLFQPLIPDEAVHKTKLWSAFASGRHVGAIVLGSSRATKVSPTTITQAAGGRAFNFALGGATLGDEAAVYGFVKAHGGPPDDVYLALDLDQLKDDGRPSGLHAGGESILGRFAGRERSWGESARRAASALDRGHTTDTLVVLKFTITGYPPLDIIYDADGYRHYVREEAAIANGSFDVDAAANRTFGVIETLQGGLSAPSPRRLAELDDLIDQMRHDRVRVHIAFTPFRPEELTKLRSTTPIDADRAATIEALRPYCGDGVDLSDTSEVSTFGGDDRSFIDGFHVASENGERWTKAWVTGLARSC